MTILPLVVCDVRPEPGDLHAEIRDGALCVPNEVAQQAASAGLKNALDLLAYMQGFPSAVAGSLGWSVPDVCRATARIELLLRQFRTDFLSAGPQPSDPSYGANNPD